MGCNLKKCVFAGTFDPPTVGHENVIRTARKIFDEVVVAVMINPQKQTVFTVEERKSLLEKLFCGQEGITVKVFDGAVVDLLELEQTPFYIRGVRNTVDFEYENANHFASKKLKDDLVTIYIPAEQDCIELSSTLVKNFIVFDKDISGYIPKKILKDVNKLLEKRYV